METGFRKHVQLSPNDEIVIQKKDSGSSNFDSVVNANFDEIMKRFLSNSVNAAIESVISNVFRDSKVVLWIYQSKYGTLWSPTHMISLNNGVIYEVFEKKAARSIYDSVIHDKSIHAPEFKFYALNPIIQRGGICHGVIEIAKTTMFTLEENKILCLFMEKMKVYSGYLFGKRSLPAMCQDLLIAGNLKNLVSQLSELLCSFFHCKSVEFWLFRVSENNTIMFSDALQSQSPITGSIGIVGMSLYKQKIINERVSKNNKKFDPQYDMANESCLCIPFKAGENRLWSIVLRGREAPPYYSKVDEMKMISLAPFVVYSIANALLPSSDLPQFDDYEQRLSTLLEIAGTLSGALDIDKLIPMIMSRAKDILRAERCSLFLVEPGKKFLITHFHGGLDKAIKISIQRGIVGFTAVTGQVVNIEDAYSDSRFDRTVDESTGYHTKSILTVPIYNNRGEITGVTEMINKTGSPHFTDDDVRMMMAFNVFCGTSLDNAKLYKASLNLSNRLKTLTNISESITNKASFDNLLTDTLEQARNSISSSRASLFIYNTDDDSLNIAANSGNDQKHGTLFARKVIDSKTNSVFSSQEIERLTDISRGESAIEKLISKTVDPSSSRSSLLSASPSNTRVSSVLCSPSYGNDLLLDSKSSDIVICILIKSSESISLGVLEFQCSWTILEEDLKLLESFSILFGVLIERNNLQIIAQYGYDELQLTQWIQENERKDSDIIPSKLSIAEHVLQSVFSIKFDASQWDGIGHFKVLFAIFHRFHLFQHFNISNELFFRFLYSIRNTYKKVPYHNWRHAIDVSQFLAYQIIVSGLDTVFTPFELFALFVSSICHDANHDGFTNVFNIKAQTPLGILFKNQSVMETHHCAIAIDIMSKDSNNLFYTLTAEHYKKMWNLVLSLILSTDMAKHFEIIKEFDRICDSNSFDITNDYHRVILMEMLLKCSDISNVSRPYELASKWCDFLCEEFFRQGDLEHTTGMEYTSPLNDRDHLDKPKSQIGFYNFVCLPLFKSITKAVPQLSVNVEQIEYNLNQWKLSC